MTLADRAAIAADRLFDRLRHRDAFAARPEMATRAGFDSLRGHRYLVLVTFRRDGDTVPSPVWFALDPDDGRCAYVKTAAHAGKVKRIRNESRVLVAACTRRGAPVGEVIGATARILGEHESERAEAALRSAFGLGRRISERFAGAVDATYLELRPEVDG